MSNFTQEELAALPDSIRQQMENLIAENEALKAKRTRAASLPANCPTVDITDKEGNVTQRDLGASPVSSGGSWYTVLHRAEDLRGENPSKVAVLAKYQTRVLKDESKLKEGQALGDRVLRRASSFKMSAAHWAVIRKELDEFFGVDQ